MHLIVGLGNPGDKYAFTRHNIGFMAIDGLAQSVEATPFKSEHKSLTSKARVNGEQVLLVKPQTYMNNSGEAVRALMDYYKIAQDKLLVIHDEVDLPYSAIRYQTNRGHGGNNGIRSIHAHLDSKDYNRLKLGVGRPKNNKMDVADHVLQNFSKEEQITLTDFLSQSVESIITYVCDGYQKAATQFNQSGEQQ